MDLGSSYDIKLLANKLGQKEKIKKAASPKLQAPSLTRAQGYCRMYLESEENMEVEQLKRIADILEEILKLVKKDMGVK